jgi:hypothetical protein
MTNTDAISGSPQNAAFRTRARRRWLRRIAFVLLVLVVAGVSWVWPPARRYALTGASYGARVACSCRYIGGRSLGDCHKDMEGPVGWVSLSEDPAARSVTASYPLLAHQTATFHEGWGCQLQPWSESR